MTKRAAWVKMRMKTGNNSICGVVCGGFICSHESNFEEDDEIEEGQLIILK